MTCELEAISELKTLCAAWKSVNDPATFVQIIKTCLDGNVITPAQFRDSLALIPTTPSLWASGKVKAHPLMQQEVVEFVSDYIQRLPL
jgi:hypothetical protein